MKCITCWFRNKFDKSDTSKKAWFATKVNNAQVSTVICFIIIIIVLENQMWTEFSLNCQVVDTLFTVNVFVRKFVAVKKS